MSRPKWLFGVLVRLYKKTARLERGQTRLESEEHSVYESLSASTIHFLFLGFAVFSINFPPAFEKIPALYFSKTEA